MAAERPYSALVSQLLPLGMPEWHGWRNYRNLGLGPENIPELIQLATDPELLNAWEDIPDNWAPYHAWRALGQFEAVEAVEPLVSLLDRIDTEDDEWAQEDLPEVFAAIGPPSIPALEVYLLDAQKETFGRATAAQALEEIAAHNPASYAACVAAITRALEGYATNDETLNAFLILNLVRLKAAGAAPLMESAFAAGRVDETIMGDWEDVQIRLGLLARRRTPTRLHSPAVTISEAYEESWDRAGTAPRTATEKVDNRVKKKTDKKDKAQRKQEKKSRQKNRKKK